MCILNKMKFAFVAMTTIGIASTASVVAAGEISLEERINTVFNLDQERFEIHGRFNFLRALENRELDYMQDQKVYADAASRIQAELSNPSGLSDKDREKKMKHLKRVQVDLQVAQELLKMTQSEISRVSAMGPTTTSDVTRKRRELDQQTITPSCTDEVRRAKALVNVIASNYASITQSLGMLTAAPVDPTQAASEVAVNLFSGPAEEDYRRRVLSFLSKSDHGISGGLDYKLYSTKMHLRKMQLYLELGYPVNQAFNEKEELETRQSLREVEAEHQAERAKYQQELEELRASIRNLHITAAYFPRNSGASVPPCEATSEAQQPKSSTASTGVTPSSPTSPASTQSAN